MKKLFEDMDFTIFGQLIVTLKSGKTFEYKNISSVECDDDFVYISSSEKYSYLTKNEIIALTLFETPYQTDVSELMS